MLFRSRQRRPLLGAVDADFKIGQPIGVTVRRRGQADGRVVLFIAHAFFFLGGSRVFGAWSPVFELNKINELCFA